MGDPLSPAGEKAADTDELAADSPQGRSRRYPDWMTAWVAVMRACHYQCQCREAHKSHKGHRCGNSHLDHKEFQLVAVAPARLVGSGAQDRYGDADQLIAWCPPCYEQAVNARKKLRQAEANAAARQAEQLF